MYFSPKQNGHTARQALPGPAGPSLLLHARPPSALTPEGCPWGRGYGLDLPPAPLCEAPRVGP